MQNILHDARAIASPRCFSPASGGIRASRWPASEARAGTAQNGELASTGRGS
jgi:hypothetical protein